MPNEETSDTLPGLGQDFGVRLPQVSSHLLATGSVLQAPQLPTVSPTLLCLHVVQPSTEKRFCGKNELERGWEQPEPLSDFFIKL